MRAIVIAALVVAANIGAVAIAQDAGSPPPAPPTPYSALSEMRYPVVAGDITARPYRVLGIVGAEVRKATVFSRSPSQEHVYRELWERAERLGADAVINAQYGNARVTGLSWGSRRSQGEAVKFLSDGEISAREMPQAPVQALPVQAEPVQAQPLQAESAPDSQ
jgi:uncharacterized protein YbjQ (UPF0145 family)